MVVHLLIQIAVVEFQGAVVDGDLFLIAVKAIGVPEQLLDPVIGDRNELREALADEIAGIALAGTRQAGYEDDQLVFLAHDLVFLPFFIYLSYNKMLLSPVGKPELVYNRAMKYRELINDPGYDRMIYLFGEDGDADFFQQLGQIKANFILLEAEDWNSEFSPWPLQAGKMSFAGKAEETLNQLLEIRNEVERKYEVKTSFIVGYSLAGLFALYAHRHFDGIAGCSSSLWFTGFNEWFEGSGIDRNKKVYLSLGDREENSRNPLMATVGDKTRELYGWLQANGNDCILEMNPGGHFNEPGLRMLKGIRWLLEE